MTLSMLLITIHRECCRFLCRIRGKEYFFLISAPRIYQSIIYAGANEGKRHLPKKKLLFEDNKIVIKMSYKPNSSEKFQKKIIIMSSESGN